MKDLYLMRHGETLFNRRDLIQGVCNSPLMVEGVAQAMHTRKAYFEKEQIPVESVWCSPEGRAVQTTQIVTDLPYKEDVNLHEMNFGRLEGQPCYLGCEQKDFATYYGTIGGETLEQVEQRMNGALTHIMETDPAQHILVVAHGCANQAFYDYWKHNDQIEGDNVLHNCSVLHYQFDPKTRQFYLVGIFNEAFETDDLNAARATGQGMDFPEVTPFDFF